MQDEKKLIKKAKSCTGEKELKVLQEALTRTQASDQRAHILFISGTGRSGKGKSELI
jgi:hypothetical protein